MRKIALPIFLSLTALVTISLIYLHQVTSVKSAAATHIVISEIQISGSTDANDEFVELYNPTDSAVDLSGWRLTRKNSAGTQSNIVSSMSGNIPARGYFLVAHPDYDGSVNPDLEYSATSSGIVANGSVLLYSDAGVTVVDKVGMGTATDFEASTAAVPDDDQSIERKANSSSTTDSMSTEADMNSGNGEDSNNNLNDFILRTLTDPQNSLSALEPQASATPTASPSPSPSTTPTATPSATPTSTPSPTPTSSPSATPTSSPTSSPSATPGATPNPFFGLNISCQVRVRTLNFGFFRISFPQLFCTLK